MTKSTKLVILLNGVGFVGWIAIVCAGIVPPDLVAGIFIGMSGTIIIEKLLS